VTEKELRDLLEEKENPSVYLGTAITGAPHIGYFLWITRMADFMNAGLKVKLLLADLHGALGKTPWDSLERRYEYYEEVIPLMFEGIGVDTQSLETLRGSSFQLERKYVLDVLKYSTFVSVNDCRRAASEVVRLADNPKLSGLVYPIMQSLDEVYLDADIQCGGVDQRKIPMFSREHLPKLGYKPRVEIMTPLIPGLMGKKMSASDQRSKIDLLDGPQVVAEKIDDAFCPAGMVEGNGVLAFLRYVIMVLKRDRGEKLVVSRPARFGGDLEFANYGDAEKAFRDKELHPSDLKKAVAEEINVLLKPVQKHIGELEDSARRAYGPRNEK